MTKEVQIVGGPLDGAIYAVPDYMFYVFVVMMDEEFKPLLERPEPFSEVDIKKIGMQIHETNAGYRAYWHERYPR